MKEKFKRVVDLSMGNRFHMVSTNFTIVKFHYLARLRCGQTAGFVISSGRVVCKKITPEGAVRSVASFFTLDFGVFRARGSFFRVMILLGVFLGFIDLWMWI